VDHAEEALFKPINLYGLPPEVQRAPSEEVRGCDTVLQRILAQTLHGDNKMTRMSEITEKRHASQEVPRRSRFAILTFARMLLANPAALRRLMVMGPDEERYARPPREYELPEYREGMQYCTSNEKYLRPTRYCNPREPEAIALANELGAYELSDYEFAEAAYWFVKTKLAAEMLPLNSVSVTLKRGTGTCYHLTSVWIALCRAAGIKARYKTFMMMLPEEMMNLEVSEGEAMTADMFNMGVREGEGEVRIDGKWVVGHVAMRPEIYARAGLPIPQFGEDAVGLTFKLIPGTMEHLESVPLMRVITMRAQSWLAPVVMERASLAIKNTLPIGAAIIEEAGGIEAYDQNARERGKLVPTEEIMNAIARLTEDAERKRVVVFEE